MQYCFWSIEIQIGWLYPRKKHKKIFVVRFIFLLIFLVRNIVSLQEIEKSSRRQDSDAYLGNIPKTGGCIQVLVKPHDVLSPRAVPVLCICVLFLFYVSACCSRFMYLRAVPVLCICVLCRRDLVACCGRVLLPRAIGKCCIAACFSRVLWPRVVITYCSRAVTASYSHALWPSEAVVYCCHGFR